MLRQGVLITVGHGHVVVITEGYSIVIGSISNGISDILSEGVGQVGSNSGVLAVHIGLTPGSDRRSHNALLLNSGQNRILVGVLEQRNNVGVGSMLHQFSRVRLIFNHLQNHVDRHVEHRQVLGNLRLGHQQGVLHSNGSSLAQSGYQGIQLGIVHRSGNQSSALLSGSPVSILGSCQTVHQVGADTGQGIDLVGQLLGHHAKLNKICQLIQHGGQFAADSGELLIGFRNLILHGNAIVQ